MSRGNAPSNTQFISMLIQTALGTQRDDELKNSVRKSWRRRLSGTLLFLMYAAVFYIVIMSLTAYQIQTRVHALNQQSNPLSIWSVTRIAGRILRLENQIDNKGVDLSIAEDELSDAEKELVEAEREEKEARRKLVNQLLLFDIAVPEGADSSTVLKLARKAEGDISSSAEFDANKDALIENSNKARSARGINFLIIRQLDKIRTDLAGLSSEIESIRTSKPGFDKTADLIDELRFFHRSKITYNDGVVYRAFDYFFGNTDENDKSLSDYAFVTLPSEVLIMLVVIAMGTMGSMISITQVFFAGEDRPITFYLFRPLLGAVVAIGVYVITKAGVIVASNLPVQADGAAKLNAFFVSFVSLISGLMSEAAIYTIRRAGTSFLRGDPVTEKARYASGVTAALAASNQSANDIYPFFGVSTDVVDKWLAETEMVPGNAQRIIAAWLRQPVRNLFSDIPPNKGERAGSATQNPAVPSKKAPKPPAKKPRVKK